MKSFEVDCHKLGTGLDCLLFYTGQNTQVKEWKVGGGAAWPSIQISEPMEAILTQSTTSCYITIHCVRGRTVSFVQLCISLTYSTYSEIFNNMETYQLFFSTNIDICGSSYHTNFQIILRKFCVCCQWQSFLNFPFFFICNYWDYDIIFTDYYFWLFIEISEKWGRCAKDYLGDISYWQFK